MKTLSQDTVSRVVVNVISDTIVECSHTVKPDNEAGTLRVKIEKWTIDFTNVKLREIVKLAAEIIKIKTQDKWRKAPDRMNAKKWDNITISVREYIDAKGTRGPVDKATAADRAVDKLSDAEFAAMVARRKAQQSK